MNSRLSLAVASSAVALTLLGGPPAAAEEIRLLSAAALQSVFKEITDDFERTSGHKLIITYRTMGAITMRLRGGEAADLVIGSTPSMATLAKEGKIDPDSRMTIGNVGVGAVVPVGTPVPRIASVEDFKRALLAAKVIVYADPEEGGAAGIHVARVIDRLGLTERLTPKTKFGAGGDVTEVTLAQGEGALGLTQISEIVAKPGAEFVGPLPDELQNYTGVTLGIPTATRPSESARTLIEFLQSPRTTAVLEAKGM